MIAGRIFIHSESNVFFAGHVSIGRTSDFSSLLSLARVLIRMDFFYLKAALGMLRVPLLNRLIWGRESQIRAFAVPVTLIALQDIQERVHQSGCY